VLHAFLALLLFSPINVALSGLAVSAISFLLYGIPLHPMLLSAAFLITFSIYTFNLVTDKQEDAVNFPERAHYFVTDSRSLGFITIGCYSAAILIGGLVTPVSIPVLCIPLALGLLYSIRISGVRLKSIFIGKNATVSLSWALEASLLPAVFVVRTPAILLMFTFIFVKGFINTILFDVRDMQGDRKARVDTIPSILGMPLTRMLLLGLNSLLVVWLIFAIQQATFLFFLPVFVFCLAFGYFYIFYLARNTPVPKMHYGLLLDGEWILLLTLFLASLWLL
jgi:4-hydroxybenzoate polyprenyltransferase